jgi:hypothetical protein
VAAPTISAITPNTGLTAGGTLVEITGTGFRVPDYPPAEGVTETPVTVRVLFGDEEGTLVGVVDEETLLVLTPSHDESGVPATAQNEPIAASNVTVENLDDDGDLIPGESYTLAGAFSFRKPILDKPTTMERVRKELQRQLQRALPRGVELVYQPHTDFDDATGDALNLVRFARLPGVGLTGKRTPKSELRGDEADVVVKMEGGGRSVVRRPATRRDLILTVVCASNSSDELDRLALCVERFFEAYTQVRIPLDPGDASRGRAEYDVVYGVGEVTYSDRQDGNVMAATGELRVFHIEEDTLRGAPEAGLSDSPDWLPHEGATGVIWPVTDPTGTVEQA